MPSSTLRHYEPGGGSGFRSAVSLHAHTCHSKEHLSFLPAFLAGVPAVSAMFEREMRRYVRHHGRAFDFHRAFWQPPLPPRAVLDSEADQILQRLGLHPVVALTDHDTIGAALALRAVLPPDAVPVSVEWSVPFRGTCFHLGVYNLPGARAIALHDAMQAASAARDEARIEAALRAIDRYEDALIVLNHPLWDGTGVGAQQSPLLEAFMARYQPSLHAVELNGYRSASENRAVLQLAVRHGLPFVGGGDRHTRAPNTFLNLTRAASFAAFADEVRVQRRTEVLMMPEYREPRAARVVAAVAEVLRTGTDLPIGAQRWTDRVFVDPDGQGPRPLSSHWHPRAPLWIRCCVGIVRALGARPLRPVVRRAFASEEGAPL